MIYEDTAEAREGMARQDHDIVRLSKDPDHAYIGGRWHQDRNPVPLAPGVSQLVPDVYRVANALKLGDIRSEVLFTGLDDKRGDSCGNFDFRRRSNNHTMPDQIFLNMTFAGSDGKKIPIVGVDSCSYSDVPKDPQRNLDRARDFFDGNWTGGIGLRDRSFDGMKAGCKVEKTDTVTDLVNKELVKHRAALNQAYLKELSHEDSDLAKARRELNGAKALLTEFFAMGLPTYVAKDEKLHSLLYGSEGLLDETAITKAVSAAVPGGQTPVPDVFMLGQLAQDRADRLAAFRDLMTQSYAGNLETAAPPLVESTLNALQSYQTYLDKRRVAEAAGKKNRTVSSSGRRGD
jgi:hypothetical protein